jgi:hypothetical protein
MFKNTVNWVVSMTQFVTTKTVFNLLSSRLVVALLCSSIVSQKLTSKPISVKNTHTAERGGAERPAACDLFRGSKAADLFPRIKSQAAGRSAVCVFLP